MKELAEAIAERDRNEFVVRRVLSRLCAEGQPVLAINRTLLRLATPATIRWLLGQSCSDRFLASVRMHARGELQNAFEELRPLSTASLDPEWVTFEREQQTRRQQTEADVTSAQQTMREDDNFLRVLNATAFLGDTDLPPLPAERLEWLKAAIAHELTRVDFSQIVWKENSCESPAILYWLLVLLRHYELRLIDDVPLVKSLAGLHGEPAAWHTKKFGLSHPGLREIDRLITAPDLACGAAQTIFIFLRQTDTWSETIGKALQHAANSDDAQLREAAVYTLCELPQSTDVLVNISAQKQVPAPSSVFDELVKRQHRGTIERRLSQAIADEKLLRCGEVDFPLTSPLDWISQIRLSEIWEKLLKLRRQALKFGLHRLASTVTETMARIDEAGLATKVAQQVSQAPAAWQPTQRTRAIEYRQRARLARAQTTEFRKVVANLQQQSSEKLLKIWCEGVTDLWPLRIFVEKAIGRRDDVVLQPIGGWNELSNEDWPVERLWDGCLDVVLIADGDNGRDWTKPDRPLSESGRSLTGRLEAAGVAGFILNRYGIENYFTKGAVETVAGPTVAQSFPLGDSVRAGDIAGYSKDNNKQIAQAMALDDLKGTDLYTVLQELQQRVAALTNPELEGSDTQPGGEASITPEV